MNKIAIFCGAAAIALASCSKYEEGPGVSFISKKERVANTWQVEEATENGDDVTASYQQYDLQLLSDGDATLAALYSLGDLNFEFQTQGTWEFQDKKEKLQVNFENDSADETYVILRLAEDELWLREEGGDLELKLMPK